MHQTDVKTSYEFFLWASGPWKAACCKWLGGLYSRMRLDLAVGLLGKSAGTKRMKAKVARSGMHFALPRAPHPSPTRLTIGSSSLFVVESQRDDLISVAEDFGWMRART